MTANTMLKAAQWYCRLSLLRVLSPLKSSPFAWWPALRERGGRERGERERGEREGERERGEREGEREREIVHPAGKKQPTLSQPVSFLSQS